MVLSSNRDLTKLDLTVQLLSVKHHYVHCTPASNLWRIFCGRFL